MFSKAVKIKSNNQVKASERKNFKTKVRAYYPDITEDDLNLILPNKPINNLKIQTHNGADVFVYAVEKRVVFFECENILFPSIYTLWKICELIPTFTTHPPVLPKLMQGADLMIPGVVLPENVEGPAAWGKFDKGTIVSINLTNNKAAVAIGRTCHSSMDMYMAAGRGRCVEVIHVFGDELCSLLAPAITLPELGPPKPKWLEPEIQQVMEDVQSVILDVDETNNTIDIEYHDPVGVTSDDPEIRQLSVEDVDALLIYSFLKCLKTEGKKLSLPMLTSTFYGTHIMSSCPEGSALDIKKSSYKKVSKFLSSMSEKGYIKVEELKKGVESVTDIAIDHFDVRSFVLDENDKPKPKVADDPTASVENMLRVTKPVLPLLSPCGIRNAQIITKADVRRAVTDYVKVNALQNVFDPRVVLLNPMLQDICGTSAEALEWSRLLEKIENRMTPVFEMKNAFQTIQCKGKPPIIILSVCTRAGNKKVTLIDNLGLFGIDLVLFAKHCQHGVAASTTINKPPGSKGEQVLVQGNQVAFVGKLLTEKYRIPKKYIRGLELAVKRK